MQMIVLLNDNYLNAENRTWSNESDVSDMNELHIIAYSICFYTPKDGLYLNMRQKFIDLPEKFNGQI